MWDKQSRELEVDTRNSRFDTSHVTAFSRECFQRYHGGQLKTAAEQEPAKKRDCKR